MDPGLVTALSGALAQNRRIEISANNLANADSVAFKADGAIFEENRQGEQHEDLRSDVPERSLKESELLSRSGDERRVVLFGEDFTDLRAGNLVKTENPLDFAIEGNGFFEVLTGDGIRLTRAGNLALNAQRQLVTRDGFLVLGPRQGDAEVLQRAIILDSANVSVDASGAIYSNGLGGENVGRLSLVQVSNPKGLKKVGRGFFEASPEAGLSPVQAPGQENQNRAPAGEAPLRNPLGSAGIAPRVHQGALEGSNVNPIQEMTRLIEAHRNFEQNTKLMQSFGEMSSQVSEIGKF